MDDPFDALAPPPGRNRRQGSAVAERFAAWRDALGASASQKNATHTNALHSNALHTNALVARSLVAVGIVAALAVGAWWLSRGRAQPVELPRAPSAAAAATSAGPSQAQSQPQTQSGTAPPSSTPVSGGAGAATTSSSVPLEVVVHVAGQVHHPGLYTVNAGGRLADAVSAAGGVTAQADLDRINLAEPLIDGARTYIPAVGQLDAPATIPQGGQSPQGAQSPQGTQAASAAPSDSGGAPGAGALVNINTADEAALDELPGVGPVTAEAIVEYRSQVGSFTQVEDLLEVRGIGDAKLEALVDLVTV